MVRLVDIAKKTGFSVNTVSHVVNGKDDVKEETRKIIEKCIEEMGYVRNLSVRKLRTGKSGLIALILDGFLNPRCSVLADEIAVYCNERGYTLCIFSTNGDEKKERACVIRAAECRVDGVIMMPVSRGDENTNVLKKAGIPYVFVERRKREFDDEPYIVYEDYRSGYLVGEYLYEKGHKDVMIVLNDEESSESKLKIDGMRDAFATYEATFNRAGVRGLSFNVHTHEKQMEEIIKDLDRYTAVVCYDDYLTMKLIARFIRMGKRIPEDISFIGSGSALKKFPIAVPITTITAVENSMAVMALDMLVEMIDGEEGRGVVLPVCITDHGSVKDIK